MSAKYTDKQEYAQLKLNKLKTLEQEYYRLNPMDWLEDKLGEPRTFFEWSKIEGMQNHLWDGDSDSLKKAWQRIADSYGQVKNGEEPSYRTIGIESGTGTSKTFMLSRLALWYLDVFPNSLVVTTAPKQDQLKIGLWAEISMVANKFKKIRPYSQLYKLRIAVEEKNRADIDLDDAMTSDSWQMIGFVAGTNADAESADKARGFHRPNMLIILEECSGIPQSIVTAFQNSCTGLTNFIIAVGNPTSQADSLHKLCQQDTTDNYRISALDYPNVVLNKELFVGGVTNISIDARVKNYGIDTSLYKAMVRGISPSQSKDSLILTEWFDQCIDFTPEKESFNSVGVDVARSDAGDKAAVSYIENSILVYIKDFQCPNASYLAYNLLYDDAQLMQKGVLNYEIPTIRTYKIRHEQIAIDGVGIGVSTVETFNNLNINVTSLTGGQWKEAIPTDSNGLPYYKFVSLRAQMYWELREDLRNKRIGINIQDKNILQRLRKELSAHRLVPSPSGIKVNDKEDVKKILGHSPNLADSYVYSNFIRKGYRQQIEIPFMNIMGE